MALEELLEEIRQQAIIQRENEKELLESIEDLSDHETAEKAKDVFSSNKHAYPFEGYLHQLQQLQTVLAAGVPPDMAVEAIDSCIDTETIIKAYKAMDGGKYNG